MNLNEDLKQTAMDYTSGVSSSLRDRYGRLIANHQEEMVQRFEALMEQGVDEAHAIQVAETDFTFAQREEEQHNKADQKNLRNFFKITCAGIDRYLEN
jgi:hypothetical protein